MTLRNPLNSNARHIDRLHTKRGGHTPYGYAYLDGKFLIDPKEQIIIRKLLVIDLIKTMLWTVKYCKAIARESVGVGAIGKL